MVSYYNPVAMFSRTGTGHHHPHHSAPTQNPYFTAPYNTPAYHHHHYPHSHHHQGGGSGTGPGVVTSTQFSPSVPTDCNHPYQHQIGNMTPETMAAAAVGWHQPNVNVMYSACASARNMVTGGYDDWTHSHAYPHSTFYHHQQPSPPNSTPSPNSTHNGGHQSPNGYPTQPIVFKSEFGSCSGGNNQENSSQEMQSQSGSSSAGSLVSSASSSLTTVPTSHSPDSGMAISDGVSSSGSPATTGTGQHVQGQLHLPHSHCLNTHHPHHHQHHQLSSTTMITPASMIGSHQINLNPQSLGNSVNNHHNGNTNPTSNSSTNNGPTGRPTQARSPYEWMKKPTYTTISGHTGGGKTRTKDKYRVVYSDTQRVELEKEFCYSRYITIRRKSELASILGLSERQVKIWFQNRRAKDRKTVRKHDEMAQREKMASMIHMQNAAVLSGNMNHGNPMCNQPNSLPLM